MCYVNTKKGQMKKIVTLVQKKTVLEINGKRISSSGNVWYKRPNFSLCYKASYFQVYAQKVNKWIIATL